MGHNKLISGELRISFHTKC